jgi:hypothetical protein
MVYSSVPSYSAAPPLTSHTGFTFGNGSTNPVMSSGVASMTVGGADGYYPALWATPCFTNNMFCQVTLASSMTTQNPGSPDETKVGPMVRCNSGFTQQVWAGADGSGIRIMTMTSGTGGTVTDRATWAGSPASGGVVLLTAVGNLYTAYYNGTAVCSWTDSGGVISGNNKYCGIVVSNYSFNTSGKASTMTLGDLRAVNTIVDPLSTMIRSSTR